MSDPSDSGNASLLVGLAQKTLQAQEHALDVVHGAPLVLQNVQTDPAGEVDVGVVDGGLEEDGGRRVRVVVGECEGELQRQALIGRLCRAGDGRRPGEKVAVGVGEGRDTGRGRHHELHELGLQPIPSKRDKSALLSKFPEVFIDEGSHQPLGDALRVIALSSATQLGSFQRLRHRVLGVLHRVVHSEERKGL